MSTLQHVGMIKKPMAPYDPLSYRSRLPSPTKVIPYKNASSLMFLDKFSREKTRFRTTNQGFFKKLPPLNTQNTGIVSDNIHTIRARREL